MLAQTCPMTTLTVVNVDAMDRPAAPTCTMADAGQESCKIAKSSARLGFVRAGGRSRPCAPYGRPPRTGGEVRAPDGPAALARGVHQASSFGRMRVPVISGQMPTT